MKVLIAEDENISRRRLEKFLEDLGYRVISCKGGLEAGMSFSLKMHRTY